MRKRVMNKIKLFFVMLTFVAAFMSGTTKNDVRAAVPDNGEIVFEILRDGQPFGIHRLHFTPQHDGMLRVDIDISMRFSIGPLTLFRYHHTNTEYWRNDRLLKLESATNDDGRKYFVRAFWEDQSVTIKTQDKTYEAPISLYSSSYWNPIMLRAEKVLNTQKGDVENIHATHLGTIEKQVNRDIIAVDHYRVEAAVPIDVYYHAETRQWVGLSFRARGAAISYRRLTPLPQEKT